MPELEKNILILSKSEYELSTELTIDWILFLGHRFFRLNGDILEQRNIPILISLKEKTLLKIKRMNFPKRFHSIWFRRWTDLRSISELINYLGKEQINISLSIKLSDCIKEDLFSVQKFLINNLQAGKVLSSISQLTVNKLLVLQKAKNVGLKIPEYIITNQKSEVIKFKKRKKNIVLKDLSASFTFIQAETIYASYGELLDEQKIERIKNSFTISFFQEYIFKKYEIRVFYLNKKIFSMAIFSQNDPKTSIDCRRYNHRNPNRNVPYKLPKAVENKLIQLMQLLNLDTGSIDILKSSDNKYYFLEVNPVGQFANVSYYCNYNLEYEIAKYLSN